MIILEEKPSDKYFTRKIKADYFIDDRNIGGLPDWGQIYAIIKQHKTFAEVLRDGTMQTEKKKKHWWSR